MTVLHDRGRDERTKLEVMKVIAQSMLKVRAGIGRMNEHRGRGMKDRVKYRESAWSVRLEREGGQSCMYIGRTRVRVEAT